MISHSIRFIGANSYFKIRPLSNGAVRGKSLLRTRHEKKDIQPETPAVTRFAPSPTGLLHLGSLRTALYNYLLARNTGGKFILRLEDTDRNRYHEEAETNITETLEWCGIQWDQEIYKQSERAQQGIYLKYVDELMEKGMAYRCFCSKERLDQLRTVGYDRRCANLSQEVMKNKLVQEKVPFTVRLKMSDNSGKVYDLLHGEVSIQSRTDRRGFDDPVLLKSDGFPTYHLANVVDDHLMGITHVIRGEEWLSSTPKHLALYKAFQWEPPSFIHIPLLTNIENDKKLSKRKGDSSVIRLKEKGILPEALVNFVALLGWSPPRSASKSTHECFTLEELTALFNLNNLTKGNVKVDMKKLWFFNRHYLEKRINSKEIDTIVEGLLPIVNERFDSRSVTFDKVKTILLQNGNSLHCLNEFNDTFHYFFELPNYDNDLVQEFLANYDKKVIIDVLSSFEQKVNSSNQDFSVIVKDICTAKNVDKKFVYHCVRFAMTALEPGTKLPVMFNILGIGEVTRRIHHAKAKLQ